MPIEDVFKALKTAEMNEWDRLKVEGQLEDVYENDPNGQAFLDKLVKEGADIDDIRVGGPVNNTAGNGESNDLVITTGGRSYVLTGDGADYVYGGSAINNIKTGAGDDVIRTGDGQATIDAGSGVDRTETGDGNDILIENTGSDSSNLGAGHDTVSYAQQKDTHGIVATVRDGRMEVDQDFVFRAPETDTIKNAEHLIGTSKPDIFKVPHFEDGMVMNGFKGDDTVIVSQPPGTHAVHYKSDGEFPEGHPLEGQPYDGRVEYQDARTGEVTDTLYLRNVENVELKDSITGDEINRIPLEEAVANLAKDQLSLNLSDSDSPVRDLVNHPDAQKMMENLDAAGVKFLDVKVTEDMSPEERIGDILKAGREATREIGLEMPQATVAANTPEIQQEIASAEEDYGIV